MNDERQKDEALSKLLQTWKPEAQLPPRFQEAVWKRIESPEPVPAPGLLHIITAWMERTLTRPSPATAYVAVLLFAGVGVGYWHAEGKTAHSESEWRARYVQSVDPYQMPRN